MKSDYVRQGIATILTAGLLTAGVVAQDGAQEDVTIKDKAPAETSVTASVKPKAKQPRPQVIERDPFVNLLLTGGVSSSTARSRTIKAASSDGDDDGGAGVDDGSLEDIPDVLDDEEIVEEVVEEIVQPSVVVKGIVSSGSGRQAIIEAESGTFVVSPGKVLGDYRVSSIGVDYITLNTTEGAHSFTIPLESAFPGQP